MAKSVSKLIHIDDWVCTAVGAMEYYILFFNWIDRLRPLVRALLLSVRRHGMGLCLSNQFGGTFDE
jgi:hypothetical protein